MEYKNILGDFFKEYEHAVEPYQIETIIRFHNKSVEFNKHTNILGTKEADSIFIRHFMDCLSIIELKDYFSPMALEGKIIMDMGTGGGFPGIILAALFNRNNFLLVEN